MKNFNDDFKRGNKKFAGPKSFNSESRSQGRYDMGRPPRSERDDAKPELFKTTCTTCGKPCEVPFRPDGVKPVLCRDCFAKKNSAGFTPALRPNDRNQGTSTFRPDSSKSPADYAVFQPTKDANYKELKQQITVLESKINRLVDLMTPVPAVKATPTPLSLDEEPVAPKAARKPKLATPAVKKAAAKKKVQKATKETKKTTKTTKAK